MGVICPLTAALSHGHGNPNDTNFHTKWTIISPPVLRDSLFTVVIPTFRRRRSRSEKSPSPKTTCKTQTMFRDEHTKPPHYSLGPSENPLKSPSYLFLSVDGSMSIFRLDMFLCNFPYFTEKMGLNAVVFWPSVVFVSPREVWTRPMVLFRRMVFGCNWKKNTRMHGFHEYCTCIWFYL